jgi:hypothetical protein
MIPGRRLSRLGMDVAEAYVRGLGMVAVVAMLKLIV